MTSAIIVGDVHISDVAPSGRVSTYKEDILAKLEFCVNTANAKNLPLIFAGDIFHVKAPNKNSHKLVQQVHEVIKPVKAGAWFLPGNHDMSNDRLDSLEKQPLGALCRMENMNLLLGWDERLPGICGIPYLTEFDWEDQRIYEYEEPEWGLAIQRFFEQYDYLPSHVYNDLIVTHAPIFKAGDEPIYNYIPASDWADWWSHDGPTSTYYGHIHECHGAYWENGHYFCNQGALSRGSLSESSITRKSAITLWAGNKFTRIEVPHKAPEEVFLFDKAIERAARKATAQSFSEAFESAKLNFLTTDEIIASLRPRVSTPKVLKVIENALEA